MLSFILYQDSFEVLNPSSSESRKYKQLDVYMSLSEVSPHKWASIDPIQLVILLKEGDKVLGILKRLVLSLTVVKKHSASNNWI